jgi:hypothetical protein
MKRALAFALVAACHGNTDAAPPEVRDTRAPVASADLHVDAGTPPRCTAVASPPPIGFGQGAELGEAVALKDGFAIGTLRTESGKRTAAVVRLGSGPPVVTDLGVAPRDALAPQPIVRSDEVYAVAYVEAKPAHAGSAVSPRGASLVVFHVGSSAERLAEVLADSDASAAYDVVAATAPGAPVGAVVAWDDSDGRSRASGNPKLASHPIVRVAALSPDLHAVRAVQVVHAAADAGTDGVDAGDPRVVSREGGYWLTYVAHRPERPSSHLPLPAGEIETPSEEATYGWVEAVMLDAEGALKGTPRRLTPLTGHVVSYAVWSHEATLEVVAKDEGPGVLGGSLSRVVWSGEGEPVSHMLVRAGVEEEFPPVIVPDTGATAWLSFLDVSGETELLPLGPSSAAKPQASGHEPLLTGARLLGASAGRVALAASAGAAWSLEWATCSR